MEAELRTQFADQTTKLRTQIVGQMDTITTAHEKLQHEVTQRREAEQMLSKIKSRLVELTQGNPSRKSNHLAVDP